jgi:carbonic anhydrase
MPIARRHLLAGLAACPACAAMASTALAAPQKRRSAANWTYEGVTGPGGWSRLDAANRVCSLGTQQSPIDLAASIKAELPLPAVNWQPQAFAVVNNGHTLQLNAAPGSTASLGETRYALVQFHFHTPSEHTVKGEHTAMEVHFVHTGPEGRLGVLGVLMVAGEANPAFHAIMQVAPAKPGSAPLPAPLDPTALLPADRRSVWRYEGSLTTPPCSETVDWVVLEQTLPVDAADIAAFRRIMPMNARPVQPLHRRFLLRS